MADRNATRCHNCGGPLEATDAKCRFCSEPIQGHPGVFKPALPAELTSAIERLRARQGKPDALISHLATALSGLLPRAAVRMTKAPLREPRLEARVGTIVYSFVQQGGSLLVQRQSFAGGFPIGMKDLLPASRWPEQLVVDIANHADATGQDWKSAVAAL